MMKLTSKRKSEKENEWADAEASGATFNEANLEAFRTAVAPLTKAKLTTDVTRKIYEQIHGGAAAVK